MEQEKNNDIDNVLARFSILDFTGETIKKKKTLEEILEEFPVLDYDYGTAAYYSHKYPLLPEEAYEIMEEKHVTNTLKN